MTKTRSKGKFMLFDISTFKVIHTGSEKSCNEHLAQEWLKKGSEVFSRFTVIPSSLAYENLKAKVFKKKSRPDFTYNK